MANEAVRPAAPLPALTARVGATLCGMSKRVGKSESQARPLAELLSDTLLTLTRVYEDAGAGDDPPHHLWVVWEPGVAFVEATQRKRP